MKKEEVKKLDLEQTTLSALEQCIAECSNTVSFADIFGKGEEDHE